MEKIIKDVQKNSREIFRVEISEYKGEEYVNIRVYYKDENDEYKPGKKGVAIKVDKYDEVYAALCDAYNELKESENA